MPIPTKKLKPIFWDTIPLARLANTFWVTPPPTRSSGGSSGGAAGAAAVGAPEGSDHPAAVQLDWESLEDMFAQVGLGLGLGSF